MTAVASVLGGDARALEPSENYTNARLTSGRPDDIHEGIMFAKRFALNAELVDVTQPLADEYPSYIYGNIQYLDERKDQPYRSGFTSIVSPLIQVKTTKSCHSCVRFFSLNVYVIMYDVRIRRRRRRFGRNFAALCSCGLRVRTNR